MIVNDLGYFKGQRRINFLNSSGLSIRNSSFRVPVNSRTVKGNIDSINKQLEELKKRGGGAGKGKELTESKLMQDLGKIAAAGGAAAILANLAAQNMTGDKSLQGIITALGGILGAASIPATSKIIEFILKQSIPLLAKAAKISFAISIAPTAYNFVSQSAGRTLNRLSGEPAIPRNYPANPHPPGSIEYNQFEQELALQKQVDGVKDQGFQLLDTVLLTAAAGLGAKVLSKLPIGKAIKAYKSRQMRKMLSSRESFATRMARKNEYAQRQSRYDKLREAQINRGVRPSKINLGMPTDIRRRVSAAARTSSKAPASIIQRSNRAVRSVLGAGISSKGSQRINKMLSVIKSSTFLKRIPIAAIPYAIFEISLMANAQEDFEKDRDYAKYKESMTGSLSRLVNTLGVGVMGAVAGATVGTFIAGPLGTLGGALLGFGGSVVASLALSELGTDSAIAEKLFGILFEDEKLETKLASGETGEISATAQPTQADLAAFNRVQRFEGVDQIDGGVETILATIRQKESSNNYGADVMKDAAAQERAKKSGFAKASASGAYQFTDGTWQGLTKKYNIGTQYDRAVKAPPAVQDMIAAAYVNEILIATNGDVSKVPVAWYTGNIRGELSAQQLAMNRGLTAEKYQADWLSMYGKQGGDISTALLASNMQDTLRQSNAATDQAILTYFMSLGTIAQVLPTSTETPAAAEQTGDATNAEIKAEAALAGVQRVVQELTRVAENVRVIQQKNGMDEQFPQVRSA